MSKQRILNISVPSPCHEDWDKMTPQEQGRFCGQCSKTVIDFSKYTDKELLEYFTKSKNKFCGNFNSLQLDRSIIANESSNTALFRRALLGTALVAGVAGTVQGQSKVPVETTIAPLPTDTTKKVVVNNTTAIVSAQPIYNTNELNIRGGGVATIQYVVDGKKVIDTDTTSSSFIDFIKEIVNRHLGISASEEGPEINNK